LARNAPHDLAPGCNPDSRDYPTRPASLAISQVITVRHREPYDWTSYAAAILLLAVVGFLVSALPARRATTVDPMVALRYG